MKLSKAQQEVMETVKQEIDFARTHTLYEWAENEKFRNGYDRIVSNYSRYGFKNAEEAMAYIEGEIRSYGEKYRRYYENERNGIVLTHCNSKTIAKLESLGLIEIIRDSNGESYGLDTIKVLNY